MANLLVDAVDKKADFKDMATVQKYLEAESGGTPVKIRRYDEKGNQFLPCWITSRTRRSRSGGARDADGRRECAGGGR